MKLGSALGDPRDWQCGVSLPVRIAMPVELDQEEATEHGTERVRARWNREESAQDVSSTTVLLGSLMRACGGHKGWCSVDHSSLPLQRQIQSASPWPYTSPP